MKRKQKMKLQNFKILTLAVVFFSSISLDVYADEEALSKRDLVEIENRIENMNAYELNERREALMEEAAFLQAEQGSSQSPTRSRAISSRLSEITAELSFIQKALIGLGSIAILNNLSDDGYDDDGDDDGDSGGDDANDYNIERNIILNNPFKPDGGWVQTRTRWWIER